ncbi:MAG: hypothetical protein JST11_29290 [Acidobacteria bacterium]|nr:hypothetical protein [Acidobacteriota bacterium]
MMKGYSDSPKSGGGRAAGSAGVAFAGGFQVNVTVPSGLAAGDYAVAVTTQGKRSPGGVTIAIR